MAKSVGPLVLLVHGAWHGAWCWAALQAELDTRGIASLAIDLPGHGASPLDASDLYGDAAEVRRVAAAHNGQVVLVGHSYGGAVISEASIGLVNVEHLVYLTAFCLDENESILSLLGSQTSQHTALSGAIRPAEREGFTTVDPSLAVDAFYAECSADVARSAIARLVPQPGAGFAQTVNAAPWKSIPSTYVVCSRDQAIHPEHQLVMAARCARRVTIDTDHSPFASRVGETADAICGALSK